jgi:hypothetical protein
MKGYDVTTIIDSLMQISFDKNIDNLLVELVVPPFISLFNSNNGWPIYSGLSRTPLISLDVYDLLILNLLNKHSLTLLLYCPCLCCVCFFFQLKWIYSGFSSVVQKEIQLPRDPINRFNTATSLCLSKLRPGFPVTRVVVFLVFSV